MGTIKHAKTSTIPAPADLNRINGPDWNEEHDFHLGIPDIEGLTEALIPVEQVIGYRDQALAAAVSAGESSIAAQISADDAAASAVDAATAVDALAEPGGAALIGTALDGTVQNALDGKVSTLGLAADNGATLMGFKRSSVGAVAAPLFDRLVRSVDVKDFGAIADGVSHPLSSRYGTLAEAQAVYPFATALTEEIDGCAIQAAVNSLGNPGGDVLCSVGTYLLSKTITIGNGTAAAASTIRGVRILGQGIPRPQYILAGMATTPSTKFMWAGGAAEMIKLAGPLVGWGVERIEFNGNLVASAGLRILSAAFGSCRDLSFIGCNQSISSDVMANSVPGVDNVDSLHNRFDNISISVPNITGAIGINLTGALNSNTDYCHFTNVTIGFASGSLVVYGVVLGSCDSNQFHNLHFIIGNLGAVCVALDYTINPVWPASNMFFGVDTSNQVISWQNISVPSAGARPNIIYGLVETNNAKWPTSIDNLVADVPPIKAKKAYKTQSASIGATNLFTCWEEGDYRVSYYMATEVASGTATVNSTIFFVDPTGQSRALVLPTLNLAAMNFNSGDFVLRMATGTAQFTTTVTGTIGTARYQYFLTVERLSQ